MPIDQLFESLGRRRWSRCSDLLQTLQVLARRRVSALPTASPRVRPYVGRRPSTKTPLAAPGRRVRREDTRTRGRRAAGIGCGGRLRPSGGHSVAPAKQRDSRLLKKKDLGGKTTHASRSRQNVLDGSRPHFNFGGFARSISPFFPFNDRESSQINGGCKRALTLAG